MHFIKACNNFCANFKTRFWLLFFVGFFPLAIPYLKVFTKKGYSSEGNCNGEAQRLTQFGAQTASTLELNWRFSLNFCLKSRRSMSKLDISMVERQLKPKLSWSACSLPYRALASRVARSTGFKALFLFFLLWVCFSNKHVCILLVFAWCVWRR